ncbi:MAG: GTPase [Chloroflexota bacterium]|nr:GTPase [Chloroflexota bacterium]
MPTNVPPQYRDAEQRFRDAVTIQAKIAALQEMLQIMPKHKGTDHLKAQLRSRLSKLMSDLETSSGGKGGRTEPFSLPKEGAGRVTLIGPTNVGKSQILSSTTGARTKVGAYELSTQEPVPGMYPYSDIYIQMVDTPPITNRATQSRLYGLLRTSDIFVFVADLTNDPIAQTEESFSELSEWGFNLIGPNIEIDEEFDQYTSKPTIIICNKADIPGALDEFGAMDDRFGSHYPVLMFSAEENVGEEELGTEIFQALNIMRVYTKSPRERLQDFKKLDPIVLSIGSTVGEAAHEVHKDLSQSLKFAILWGKSGKFEGQRVGRNHRLHDGDVIEIHS